MVMLAAQADVEARLRRELTEDESSHINDLLEEVSELVTGWLRCTPDPVPDGVRIVVSRIAARSLTTPAVDPTLERESHQIGPWQRSRGFSSDASSGVWLTRQDKAKLRPHSCRSRAGNVPTSKW